MSTYQRFKELAESAGSFFRSVQGKVLACCSNLLTPPTPKQFKPIAIVVSAQTGNELVELENEVEAVSKILVDANFNVVPLKEPNLKKVTELFSKNASEHNRVALFHFAGHSNRRGVALPGQTFNFHGLASFLKKQESLRLVFLNGCSSEAFEDAFFEEKGSKGDVCSITTRSPIYDETARVFAERFYEEWLGKNDGVSIADAFDYGRDWALSADDVPDCVRGDAHNAQQEELFPWTIKGQGSSTHNTCVNEVFAARIERQEFVEKRSFKPLYLLPLLFMFAVAYISLSCCYDSVYSSPAFQASYGYAFSDAEINSRIELASFLKKGRASTSQDERTPEHGFFVTASGKRPTKGFRIELGRAAFGIFALLLTYLILGPFSLPENLPKPFVICSSVLLWLGVVGGVVFYHLAIAPKDLATEWSRENEWLAAAMVKDGEGVRVHRDAFVDNEFDLKAFHYMFEDKAVWINAGETSTGKKEKWAERFEKYLSDIELEQTKYEKDDIVGDKPSRQERFRRAMEGYGHFDEMFLHPYIAYAFYSAVLFGGVAYGVFIFLLLSLFNTFNKIAFLNASRVSVEKLRKHRGAQQKIAKHAFKIMKDSLRRFLAFSCLLLGFVVYEISFGFLTLAQNAKLLTLAVFVLLIISLAFAGYVFLSYNEAYSEIEQDERLKVSGPREILRDPVIIFLWGLVVWMIGYTILAEPWSFLFS